MTEIYALLFNFCLSHFEVDLSRLDEVPSRSRIRLQWDG